jgi:hypothetical protein
LSFGTYMCAPCGRVRPGVQGGLHAPKIRLNFIGGVIPRQAAARETLVGLLIWIPSVDLRWCVIRHYCLGAYWSSWSSQSSDLVCRGRGWKDYLGFGLHLLL